ncbi:MAG: APC family permease, partial [Fimbriimonas sp.]
MKDTKSGSEPTPGFSWKKLKHKIFGAPIASKHAHSERLGPVVGLAVFSSDALSSVAYATEAILSVLILHSVGALQQQFGLTIGIVVLICIVAWSYQQTIHAYPGGGGSYVVASENLGEVPGLVAGGALLIDYILTVSVSVAAGVAAIVSAQPHLHPLLVPMALGFVAIIAFANLRGVRESGAVFAVPTYGFVIGITVLLAVGIFKSIGNPIAEPVVAPDPQIGSHMAAPFLFLILRAFAAGCTALTGIEAVSNGVQAFRKPEARNATITLRWMSGILAVLFLGMGYISQHIPTLSLHSAVNPEYRTLLSQVAAYAFGQNSFGFYAIQALTAAILVLAANTAFADFPRLASLLARDGYLPRALARQGDRLVFHNGILLLSVASGLLIWHFHGELDQLLPLYAVGVFTAFTLSQVGMVRHWQKERTSGWRQSAVINGIGAILCFIVLLVIAITKFTEGAWMVLVLVPIICVLFYAVKQRYRSISKQLATIPAEKITKHYVIVTVPRYNAGIVRA